MSGKIIFAGNYHFCVFKIDGTVVAWGSNEYGQTSVPEGLNNVVAVDAGGDNSIALKKTALLLPGV